MTAAGPAEYRGDLRQIVLERFDGEASEVVPLRTRTVGVPHLMLYRGLRRLMSQHWDVVHCWEEPYVAAAAQIARRAPASAAFVFATFQNIVKDYPFPLAAFERQVLARADGWIAFGKTARETQLTRDVRYAELPSRTISPGVDTAAFVPSAALRAEARATLGWKPDALVVGFVGRFVPEKGIRLLLDALSRQQVRWSALFVGNGPERPRIDAFGRDWPGRVRIVADASHDDVPRWLNAMDVMCAPSQTTVRWREQFGRMLVEAMACGVPVIASDCGEIPNVVGDAAIVVPEHTVEQWAAAIDRLLGDADARRHYGEHGRARVNERFAWPIAASQHVQFFEELS